MTRPHGFIQPIKDCFSPLIGQNMEGEGPATANQNTYSPGSWGNKGCVNNHVTFCQTRLMESELEESFETRLMESEMEESFETRLMGYSAVYSSLTG